MSEQNPKSTDTSSAIQEHVAPNPDKAGTTSPSGPLNKKNYSGAVKPANLREGSSYSFKATKTRFHKDSEHPRFCSHNNRIKTSMATKSSERT